MNLAAFFAVVATLSLAYVAATSWSVRYRSLRRLYEDQRQIAGADEPSIPQAWLARWLSLAGYRRPGATALFVTTTAVSVGIGLVAGQFYRVTLARTLVEMVATVPGGAGEVLAAILKGGPWILFFVAGLAPALVVRAERRARVRAVEQDLPLVLELFATMGEAGLGFDAALSKIVRAQEIGRPLIVEFVNFQLDMLAGIPRIQALRQLARRVEVPSVTSFTSSLIQAEQVGASMAETLRHQADDLRQRRRENALLQAQALPVKLVFPLVICFLPGIFVSTLAPVIYQMIQVAGGALTAPPDDEAGRTSHACVGVTGPLLVHEVLPTLTKGVLMIVNRRLCAALAGSLVASACATTSPLLYQQCYNADRQLAGVLQPLEALRAKGCDAGVPEGTSECERLRRELERLVVVCPGHTPTLMANAVFAYDEHRPAASQQFLDQILAQSRSYPNAAVLRARIAIEEGNVPFARRLLEQQIRLAPDHAALHEAYGAALYLGGEMAEARHELATAGALGAPRWRIAYHLGLVEEGSGHFDEARRYYSEALEANPGWAPAESRLKALRAKGTP